MAQLNTTQDILQYAKEQTGITQQDTVGGSLYCEMIDADQAEWFRGFTTEGELRHRSKNVCTGQGSEQEQSGVCV